MKKILNIIILLVSMFLLTGQIKGVCYDENLNNWAQDLKVKFIEINEEYLRKSGYTKDLIPYSYLIMLNKPRVDLKITASDSFNENVYNVEYDNMFSNYVIGSEVHFKEKKYTVTIYMSEDANTCAGEKIKEIVYTVPAYNTFNDTVYCENNSDAKLCGAYTFVDDKEKAEEIIENYYEKNLDDDINISRTWYEKMWKVSKEYALYVLIPLFVVTFIYIIRIHIIKKKGELK